MPMPKAALALIAIASVSVIALSILISSNPLLFPGLINVRSENRPTEQAIEEASTRLAQGIRAETALPARTIYTPGESFEGVLMVANHLGRGASFHVNVVKDASPDSTPVILYQKETGRMGPGDQKRITLGVITYPQTSEGTFSYWIYVCTASPCGEDSQDIYAVKKINFGVYR